MFTLGICMGLVTAVFQSFSYLFSAWFVKSYRSGLRLLIASNIVMGIFTLPMVPFVLPELMPEEKILPFSLTLLLWIGIFAAGQGTFFALLRKMESSRASSLLGFKILVLAAIYMVINHTPLNFRQLLAVLLCTAAGVAINWSGGKKFTFSGGFWLAATVIFYSFADIVETRLVTMPASGNIIRDSFCVSVICYAVMSLATLPVLFKVKINKTMLLKAVPFSLAWYLSQVTLYIAFGTVGTVFSNVLMSFRGVLSVFLGALAAMVGFTSLEAKLSGKDWIRRGICALAMAGAIILYSFASAK